MEIQFKASLSIVSGKKIIFHETTEAEEPLELVTKQQLMLLKAMHVIDAEKAKEWVYDDDVPF